MKFSRQKLVANLAGLFLRWTKPKIAKISDKEGFEISHIANVQKMGVSFNEKLRNHFRSHWIKNRD